MFKKIALIMLCALPFGLFAQEKLGHVNSQEIIKLCLNLLLWKKQSTNLVHNGKVSSENAREYNVKIKDYQEKQKDMADGIKQVRQSEIQEMEQRIVTFQQTAYTDLQKKQQELGKPCDRKVRKAITDEDY
jgi:outer membrane protein